MKGPTETSAFLSGPTGTSAFLRRGMTLIEVMFATVIMSTMLAAAFGAVGSAAKTRLAQRESATGLALGRLLLTEVLQHRYQDLANPVFGVEAGETRAAWDDVDDYHGLNEATASFANGAAVPGAAGWRRQVSVAWVTVANPTVVSATETGLKRVTVTVTSPTGRVTTVTGLRSNKDRYDIVPSSQSTFTCWVGISLQVGERTAGKNVQGVHLVNMRP